jgi:hypothetical protein
VRPNGRPLGAALRVPRQLARERRAVLDDEHALPQRQVTTCMTALAECTLERALARSLADAEARHGGLFLELAAAAQPGAGLRARFDALAAAEAELIAGLPFAHRMHAGPPEPRALRPLRSGAPSCAPR